MEKYLVLILLSAPGFIARRVARCLGDKPSKRGEFESALIYFAYSLGSLFLTFFVAWGLGMFSALEPWSALETKLSLPWFAALFMFISIICSVSVGVFWCVWIEKWVINKFNNINKSRKVNEVYLEGSMLHKLFDDNEDHFIIIEKDNKRITAGLFQGLSSPTSERVEISVTAHPEYIGWLEFAKDNPDHELNKVKGVYFDLASGTVIKELKFPAAWGTTSKEQVLVVPEEGEEVQF